MAEDKGMRLYAVTIERTMYVVGSDADSAEETALHFEREECFPPRVHACDVTSASLNSEASSSLPWNDERDEVPEMTLAEWQEHLRGDDG